MTQTYRFNGQSSEYIIRPSGGSVPTDYVTVDINDEEQYHYFYLDVAYGLFHTVQAQQNAFTLLKLVHMHCLMEPEDIGNALVAAIKDKRLTAYKDKAKVFTENYSNNANTYLDKVVTAVVAAVRAVRAP